MSEHETDTRETVVDKYKATNSFAAQIQQLRQSIDGIDTEIVKLLARRFAITDTVGQLKAQAGFAPADPDREHQQVAQLRALAEQEGLDPMIVEQYHALVASVAKERHAHIAHQQLER